MSLFSSDFIQKQLRYTFSLLHVHHTNVYLLKNFVAQSGAHLLHEVIISKSLAGRKLLNNLHKSYLEWPDLFYGFDQRS